jgi:hypothetical protein
MNVISETTNTHTAFSCLTGRYYTSEVLQELSEDKEVITMPIYYEEGGESITLIFMRNNGEMSLTIELAVEPQRRERRESRRR